VSDFRNNPILRANVEDEYEKYVARLKEKAETSWNKRV
jgi:putative transposon-encoded protein